MLYFNFIKNYEEFKDRFGIRTNACGTKTRMNNILLSFLKQEFKQKRVVPDVSNLEEMYTHVVTLMKCYSSCSGKGTMLGDFFPVHSSQYIVDNKGLCDDGDVKSVRYIRKDNGRVFKMKAGKFMRHLITDCPQTTNIAEQAIIYVCETFADKWKAYVMRNLPDFELVVDDDFASLYDGDCLREGFNSCMTNKGFTGFYRDLVNASAASLRDKEGFIVARCIIFNEVFDETSDKVYRLAERQYARNEDNSLKQLLVDKLIGGGYIDGYKKIGASCHEPRLFLLNNGESFSSSALFIKCKEYSDEYYAPYMDSFKWLLSGRLYNYDIKGCDAELTTTNGSWGWLESEYDEYHNRYCQEVTEVNYWDGDRWISCMCDSSDLDNFSYLSWYNGYYEDNYIQWSKTESLYIIKGEYVYSEWLNDYLFKSDAFFSVDGGWFQDEDQYEEWLAEHKELIG